MIREFFVLTRIETYQLKNKLRFGLKERPVVTLALILLGLGFYAAI